VTGTTRFHGEGASNRRCRPGQPLNPPPPGRRSRGSGRAFRGADGAAPTATAWMTRRRPDARPLVTVSRPWRRAGHETRAARRAGGCDDACIRLAAGSVRSAQWPTENPAASMAARSRAPGRGGCARLVRPRHREVDFSGLPAVTPKDGEAAPGTRTRAPRRTGGPVRARFIWTCWLVTTSKAGAGEREVCQVRCLTVIFPSRPVSLLSQLARLAVFLGQVNRGYLAAVGGRRGTGRSRRSRRRRRAPGPGPVIPPARPAARWRIRPAVWKSSSAPRSAGAKVAMSLPAAMRALDARRDKASRVLGADLAVFIACLRSGQAGASSGRRLPGPGSTRSRTAGVAADLQAVRGHSAAVAGR